MKAQIQTCQSCGSELEGAVTSFGVVCRVCALRASCTPGATGSEAQTTWAEVFPQLEVECAIREREGESTYLARGLDGEEGCRAILQVATGEALAVAGGAAGLATRVRNILEADLDGTMPILDSGDLADAFFLVAKAPDLPRLSEILVGRDAGEIGLLIDSAARQGAQVAAQACQAGFTQPFDPELCFLDEDTGQVAIVPSLLPGDAEGDETRPAAWTVSRWSGSTGRA